MSTIGTTITSNIYYGTAQYPSPLTITNTGAVITGTSGINAAVEGSGGGTLVDQGTVIASASGVDGVFIDGAAGTLINAGLIQGTVKGVDLAAAGNVGNAGTIQAGGNAGIALQGAGGGTYTNSGKIYGVATGGAGVVLGAGGSSTFGNSGTIKAYYRALYMQSAGYAYNSGIILTNGTGPGASAAFEEFGGTLVNHGTIVNSASFGDGVAIEAAGTAVNAGSVQGYFAGINMAQGGVLTNSGSGRIVALSDTGSAVLMQGNGSATLTNQGTIFSATGNGAHISSLLGGTVTNSGLINAYLNGLYLREDALVTNLSTIISTGANSRAAVQFQQGGTLVNQQFIVGVGFGQIGVAFNGAGTIINSGTIQGYFTGVDMGGAGTVINDGVMLTSRTGFIAYQADVEMPLGGSFTNASGAYVKNGVFMNAGGETGASAILVDAGTITDGIGMNEESSNGVPIHEGTGTVILSGTVSGGASDPIPIYFGGSYALLVLQHGYAIGGVAEAGGTNPHVIQLLGSAGAPVTVNFNPSSFSNFGTVAFAAGSGTYGTLAVAASADVPGTIAGFTGPHDVIDLGFIGDTNHDATAVLNPLTDQLTVTGDNGSTVLQLASGESYPLFQAIPDAAGTGTDVETICFCRGTRIMTEHGEVEVEHLRIGDRVTLFDGGSAPIRWIGEAQVLATRGRRDAATPVIIRKGALEDNVPNHDLRVTKAHSLYLDAVLIPVEFLVNHRSILWDDHAQEVAIYHVELPEHGVLFANGAPAESYRDDGNRWLFRNADSGRHLPPMPPCAPVLTGGAKVDTVWRRLLDRCRPRHELPLTDDPDLHLMVDGSRLQPRRTEGRDHIFHLPDAAACICIASRSAVPQEMGFARDPRNLGVAVARITARQGSRLRIIEADHPMLDTGFHAFECDNGFRWTAGDAVIPSAVLADFRGPVELVLSIASTTHYPDDGARLAAA